MKNYIQLMTELSEMFYDPRKEELDELFKKMKKSIQAPTFEDYKELNSKLSDKDIDEILEADKKGGLIHVVYGDKKSESKHTKLKVEILKTSQKIQEKQNKRIQEIVTKIDKEYQKMENTFSLTQEFVKIDRNVFVGIVFSNLSADSTEKVKEDIRIGMKWNKNV